MKKIIVLLVLLLKSVFSTYANEPVENVSFEKIRTLLDKEGVLAIGKFRISGVIISDKECKNLEVNPNISSKGNEIDFSVNDKTVYIQDVEGKYGFRIQLMSVEDNVFSRYDKVVLDVEGLTLKREDNPSRYTIIGLTSDKVLERTAGSVANVQPKVRAIEELTDEDIYTYVTLKDVQMAFPHGNYVNVHEAYAYGGVRMERKDGVPTIVEADPINRAGVQSPFFDCAPNILQSKGGFSIYYLMNMQTPWRRIEGAGVPKGSGNFSGIVVHSWLPRYGDENTLGKYQIRPIDQSDIALDTDEKTRFTEALATWTFNRFAHPLSTAKWSSETNIVGGSHGFQYSNVKMTDERSPGVSWDFRYMVPSDPDFGPGGISPEIYNPRNKGALLTITSVPETGGSKVLRYATLADCDNLKIIDKYTSWTNTNNVYGAAEDKRNSNVEGLVCDGAMGLYGHFWDAKNNRGNGALIQFSTRRVTEGKLSIAFTIGANKMGATHGSNIVHKYWHLEYSTNKGATYTKLPGSDFILRPGTYWDPVNLPLWTTPGNIPYVFYLPDELLNKPLVWIKIVPSKDSASYISKQEVKEEGHSAGTTAGWLRFGEISVSVNK